MERVFLIGFMGSGKSTVGHTLEQLFAMDFVDTDHYIEKKEKRKISDIFAKEGEPFFRELETEALRCVNSAIISTGGGIIERKENIEIMKERGMIVFLSAPFEEIARRLQNDRDRPLWKQDDGARAALFERRKPLYTEAADLIIDTEGKTGEQIAKIIYDYLNKE